MSLPHSLKLARAVAAAAGVRSLATGALQNPKVAKSAKARRAYTLSLHLAPAFTAAHPGTRRTVCAWAGKCVDTCLDGSGNPAYATGKARARINRTRLYWSSRQHFMLLLVAEIAAHVVDARRQGLRAAARLNATSDILYERIPMHVPADLRDYLRARYSVHVRAGDHESIMSVFPRVQFYDYTKIPVDRRAGRPRNYHLTYSYDPANAPQALQALRLGFNVAVAFQGRTLPDYADIGAGLVPVVDGDVHDYRPADPSDRPRIIGLRFKRITAPAIVARIGQHAARTGEGFALPVSIN